MTAFDYSVLAVMGVSLVAGMWRGLVSEVLALVGWVAAFLVARRAAPAFAPELALWTDTLRDPGVAGVVAFVAVFVVVVFAFALLRTVLRGLLRVAGMGAADRALGGIFGLARGALIVLFAVALGGLTAFPQQHWWRTALLAGPLETTVVAMKPWLPQSVAGRIRYR
ncbi:MAG: CvpA family protein [Betaproteobacteria bacterium]|nr:CvpA family protein [Betaproteobacteria bacterium]